MQQRWSVPEEQERMFGVDVTEPEGCQGANHRPGEDMD